MNSLLLTGATGFVGSELLARWLRAHAAGRVHCLVRAPDAAALARRREQILAWCRLDPEDARRVIFHAGDVQSPALGLGDAAEALASEVDEVWHTAASTRFDLTLDDARAVNVEGLSRVLEFARLAERSGGLRRFHHVSTAFSEAPASGFRNAYEASKHEAEELALEASRKGLPTTVYRPSIIVGDSRTGRTPHFRVLYEPMKWVYLGKTDLLPCRPSVRLDVVPIDWVCDTMLDLAARGDTVGGRYTLSCGESGALSIGDIIEIALESGNARLRELGEPQVARPRVISPEQVEAAEGAERERLAKLWQAASGLLRAYAPYMLDEQLFDPSGLPHELEKGCPQLRDYLATLVRYAAEVRYREWADLDVVEA